MTTDQAHEILTGTGLLSGTDAMPSRMGQGSEVIRSTLRRLYDQEDTVAKAIATAITEAFCEEVEEDEAAWVDQIESLRNKLNSSTAEISIALPYATAKEKSSTVGDVCRRRSKKPPWTLMLFKLVRHLRPTACLELGTCLGISAAYQAAALELNGSGTMITLEGAPALAALAERSLAELDLLQCAVRPGLFRDTLAQAQHDLAPVDFAFIDGHHDERATVAYFEQIYPSLTEAAVVVFDDISWSPGMERAWATIAADERVAVAVDLSSIGICVVGASGPKQEIYKLSTLTRMQAAFGTRVAAVRDLAQHLPAAARVLVVSEGDDALLNLGGAEGWHFPRTDEGAHAGHHPADSADAIAQLERLRANGVDFLLFPEPARWWLDYYVGFRDHLDARHRRIVSTPRGVLYQLSESGEVTSSSGNRCC